ncbi:MAG TPA: hypothetical protein IAB37_02450 [Candidatus Faecivivens stercoravium]|uniref:Uncharacterized protein n=1 Tax=Candidatus Faecivivens stercoravium TaxID=2840803 RepID=A0A9D1DWW5_9FIRM|nr:hypothetical protein [Candidatus Faecivivens stercoravium]
MQNPYPDKSRKRRAFVSAAGYGVLNLAVAVWGRLTDETETFLLVGPFMLLPIAAMAAGLTFGGAGAQRTAAFAGYTAVLSQLVCRLTTGSWNAEAMLVTAAMAIAGAGTGAYFIRRAERKAKVRPLPVPEDRKKQ